MMNVAIHYFLRRVIASVLELHLHRFTPGALQIKLTNVRLAGEKVYHICIWRPS